MEKKEEPQSLRGTVESIIYRNEQNDYCVIGLIGEDGAEMTAVGALPCVTEGEEVVLYGHYVTHATYGRQFAADSYEKVVPTDIHAILRYLSSGAVRGIGPATAARIVNRYGTESLNVIEEHPEWLADIPGISAKKAAAISESYREQSGARAVMLFCREYFGAAVSARVYKHWGPAAVSIIRENPYRLCADALGVGFPKADEIAASLGLDRNAPARLYSGLRYLLSGAASSGGHSCLPRRKLLPEGVRQLGVDEPTLSAALDGAVAEGVLVAETFPGDGGEGPYIYLPEYARAEAYVAARLLALDRGGITYSPEDTDLLIARAEGEFGIRYARGQRAAISEAMAGGILIVTGGPGTGKTTVIRALLRIFDHLGHHVALAAPTGRAAKRMSEVASYEARTLHRMLEMERTENEEPRFRRDAHNPLDEDVVIVDEASMMDLPITEALLAALKNGTRLILIGDADQLPSVGVGNVLCDLIRSEKFRTVRLNEIFRQSRESLIVTNAHRINRGEMPLLDVTDSKFFFVERPHEADIPKTVTDLLCRRLPRTYGEDIRQTTQVITPSRRGRAGTEALNTLLQAELNPPSPEKREWRIRGRVFREGDRVMQTRNNYDIFWDKAGAEGSGIFNGDIGIIEEIDPAGRTLSVRYDDRLAHYADADAEELEHAYAITVHKSQGSEYPVVILPLYECAPQLLTRNLIYTAVTRARRMVVLVGRRDIAARMVENDRHDRRYTGLCARLKNEGAR